MSGISQGLKSAVRRVGQRGFGTSSKGLGLRQASRPVSTLAPTYRRGVVSVLALATCAAAKSQFSTTSLSMAHCHAGEGGVAVASETPKETFRKDYTPSDYKIPEINMYFDLAAAASTVTTTQTVVPTNAGADLVLDGEDCIKLVSLKVNGEVLKPSDYAIEKDILRVKGSALPSSEFKFESTVELSPKENLALSGLYASGEKLLCTQCEAEGFRRITYHLDRPDILSKYTVRLESDKATYPQLLSNGNMVDQGDLDGGRHYTVWEDPFPKPSYLFAVVGGDLGSIHGTYTTATGKEVALGIYCEKKDQEKLDHALYSIKKSMKWDEETFGLECDLDVYNIVATDDFNMGAMENKGLNIFNSAYVLADPTTATDADYENILGVIGHEYFHNWTGNRVTVRDWFQLTLKEGLTVFRDQWFSSDMTGEAVKRIGDVRSLRGRQFQEDAGPMAHPIRPESYISMDNFYTATVYSKGAEVVRMYRTILGEAGFKKGMKLYFERHDGDAVTCDDFRAAMSDANNVDLTQFERWYTQAGTPTVHVKSSYDAAAKKLSLTLKQVPPTTPGPGQKAEEKKPWHIPVTIGLLSAQSGAEISASQVLQFKDVEQTFTFDNIAEEPVLSLFRGFSAPVKVVFEGGQSDAELAFLMAHDTDTFNRWDAGDRLSTNVIMGLTKLASPEDIAKAEISGDFVEAIRTSLKSAGSVDPALLSATLTLPDLGTLSQTMEVIDVEKLVAARKTVKKALGAILKAEFESVYNSCAATGSYEFNSRETGRRRLRNTCLDYLCADGSDATAKLAKAQYDSADCMSDRIYAFMTLAGRVGSSEKDAVVQDFYDFADKDALVLNKWFAVQANADMPGQLDRVKELKAHPDFIMSNPNRCRSLISIFAGNMPHFHAADGKGYEFVRDAIVEIDKLNPQVAARMCGAFSQWKRFDAARQALMKAQLETIQKTDGLSKDTYEVATRCLK